MQHIPFVRRASAIAVGVLALSAATHAQTLINMPPPPKAEKAPAQSATSTGGTGAAAATSAYASAATRSQSVDVGDVALAPYANARSGTYDTYSDNGMYDGGIRVHSYPRYFPQFVWGPFWGWNWGWSGMGFHSCP